MKMTGATRMLIAGGLAMALSVATADDSKVVKKPSGAQVVAVTPVPKAFEQELATLKSPALQLSTVKVMTRSPAGQAKVRAVTQSIAAEAAAASSLRSPKDSFTSVGVHQSGGFKGVLKVEPGITDVNHKKTGFIVSPGGYLTVNGNVFGDGMGQVNVIGGGLPSGGLALRIVDWHDTQIYAFLPTPLRGLIDQDVVLQVVARDGKTYRFNGGKFVAAREEVTFTNGIARLVRVIGGPPAVGMGVGANDGYVYRETAGKSINCFQPGQDVLAMVDVGRGFVVVGLASRWGRSDAGDGNGFGSAGDRMFYPGYAFGDWYSDFRYGDCIKVNWGVWRSHTSPSWGSSARDWCQSYYQITSVTLSGPAGVSPF